MRHKAIENLPYLLCCRASCPPGPVGEQVAFLRSYESVLRPRDRYTILPGRGQVYGLYTLTGEAHGEPPLAMIARGPARSAPAPRTSLAPPPTPAPLSAWPRREPSGRRQFIRRRRKGVQPR